MLLPTYNPCCRLLMKLLTGWHWYLGGTLSCQHCTVMPCPSISSQSSGTLPLLPTKVLLSCFSCFNEFFCLINWNIVALQCYVSSCCTAKWVSYTNPYTPVFWISFPFRLSQNTGYSSLSHKQVSLVTSFMLGSGEYMCQSRAASYPHPSLLPPFDVRMFVLYICVSISVLQIRSPIPCF